VLRLPGNNALYNALKRELEGILGAHKANEIDKMLSVRQDKTTGNYIVGFAGKQIEVRGLVPIPVRVRPEGQSRAETDFGIVASWGPQSNAAFVVHPELRMKEGDQGFEYVRPAGRLARVLAAAVEENIPITAAVTREAQALPEDESGRPSNFVTVVEESTPQQVNIAASSLTITAPKGSNPIDAVRALGSTPVKTLRGVEMASGGTADISRIVGALPVYGAKEGHEALVAKPAYLAETPAKLAKRISMAGRQGTGVYVVKRQGNRMVIDRQITSLDEFLGRPTSGPGVVRSFDILGEYNPVMAHSIMYTALPGYPGATLVDPSVLRTRAGEEIRTGTASMIGGRTAPIRERASIGVNTLMARLQAIAEDISAGRGELAQFAEPRILRGAGEDVVAARLDLGEIGEVTAEAIGIHTGYAIEKDYRLAVPYYYDERTGQLHHEPREGVKPITQFPGARDLFDSLKEYGLSIIPAKDKEIALRARIIKEGPWAIKSIAGLKGAPAIEPYKIESVFGHVPSGLIPQQVTSEVKISGLTALSAIEGRLRTIDYSAIRNAPTFSAAVQSAEFQRASALLDMLGKSGIAVDDGDHLGAMLRAATEHEDVFKAYYGDEYGSSLRRLSRIFERAGGLLKTTRAGAPYIDFGSAYASAAMMGEDPTLVSRYEQLVGDVYTRNVLKHVSEQTNALFADLDKMPATARAAAEPSVVAQALQIAEEAAQTYGMTPIDARLGLSIRFGRPGIYREFTDVAHSPYIRGRSALVRPMLPAVTSNTKNVLPPITATDKARVLAEHYAVGNIQLNDYEQSALQRVFGGNVNRYFESVVASQDVVSKNVDFLKWAFGDDAEAARAWLGGSSIAGIFYKDVPFTPNPEHWGQARLNLEDLTSLYALASGFVNDEFGKMVVGNMLAASDIEGGPFSITESNAYRGWRSMIAGYVATARGWNPQSDLGNYGAGIATIDKDAAMRLDAIRSAVEQEGNASYRDVYAAMQKELGDSNLMAFRLGDKTMYLPSPKAIIGAAYDPDHPLGEYGAQGLLRGYSQVLGSLLNATLTGNREIIATAYESVEDFYQRQLVGKVSGKQLNRLMGTMAEKAGAYSARYQISYNLAPNETYIPRQRLQQIARTYGFKNASQMFKVMDALGGDVYIAGLRQPNIGMVPVPMRVVSSGEMTERFMEAYASLGYSGNELKAMTRDAMRFANTLQLVGPGLAEAGQGDYDYDPMSVFPLMPRMSKELITSIDQWRRTASRKMSLEDYVRGTLGEDAVNELAYAQRYIGYAREMHASFQTTEDYVRGTVPRVDAAAFSEFAKSLQDEQDKFTKLSAIARGEQAIGPSGRAVRDIGEAIAGGWRGKGESPMGVTYNARRMMLLSMQSTGTPRERWLAGYRSTTPLYQHTIDIETKIRGGLVNFAYPFMNRGEHIGVRAQQIRMWQGAGSTQTFDLAHLTRNLQSPQEFGERMKSVVGTAAALVAGDLFPHPDDVPKGFKSRSGPAALTSLIGGHVRGSRFTKFHDDITRLYERTYSGEVTEKSQRAARARAIQITREFIESMTPEEIIGSPASTMFVGTLYRQYFAGNEAAQSAIYQLVDWANGEQIPDEMRGLMARGAIVGAAQHVWSKKADVTDMPKIAGVVQKAVDAIGGLQSLSPELRWTASALMAGQVPVEDPYAGERNVSLSRMLTGRGRISVRHLAGLVTGNLFDSEKGVLVGRALGVDVRSVPTKAMRRGQIAEEALFKKPYKITSLMSTLLAQEGGTITPLRQAGSTLRVKVPWGGGQIEVAGVADILPVVRDDSGKIIGAGIFDVKAPADNRVPNEIREQYALQTALYEKLIAASTPEQLQDAFPELSKEDAERVQQLAASGQMKLGLVYATQHGGEWEGHLKELPNDLVKAYRSLSLQDLLTIAADQWMPAGLPTTQTDAVNFLRRLEQAGQIKVSGLEKIVTGEHVIDRTIEEILSGYIGDDTRQEMKAVKSAVMKEKIPRNPDLQEKVVKEATQKAQAAAREAAKALYTPFTPVSGGGGSGDDGGGRPPTSGAAAFFGGDDDEFAKRMSEFTAQAVSGAVQPIIEGIAQMLGDTKKVHPVGFGKFGKYLASVTRFSTLTDEALSNVDKGLVKRAYGREPRTLRQWFDAAARSATRIATGRATAADMALQESGFLQQMYNAASALTMSDVNDLSRLTETDNAKFIAELARMTGMDVTEAEALLGAIIETQSGGATQASPISILSGMKDVFKSNRVPKTLQRALSTIASPSWRRRATNAIDAIRAGAPALGLDKDAPLTQIVQQAFEIARSGEFESDEQAAIVRDILEKYRGLGKMRGVSQIAGADDDVISHVKTEAWKKIDAYKPSSLYAAYKKYVGSDLDERAQRALEQMSESDIMRAVNEIGDYDMDQRLRDNDFDLNALTKTQYKKLYSHVKRATALASLEGVEEARPTVERYRRLVQERWVAEEGILPGIETAQNIAEATGVVAPEEAREAAKNIVPPSVLEAHKKVAEASAKVAESLNKYQQVLDTARDESQKYGKATRETVEALKKQREEVARWEAERKHAELLAKEQEALFEGDTEKAARYSIRRNVLKKRMDAGVYPATETTRELAAIESEYGLDTQMGGLKAAAAKFARGFAMFYAMRIWKMATRELSDGMQAGEAWAGGVSKATFAAGGLGFATPSEQAALLQGSGAMPYAGWAKAGVAMSRALGPIPAFLEGATGLVMASGVLRNMGFTEGVLGTVGSLSGGALAGASLFAGTAMALSWMYGASQDDLLGGKIAASTGMERFWLTTLGKINWLTGGDAIEQAGTVMAYGATGTPMPFDLLPQYTTAVKKYISENEEYAGIGPDALAAYAARLQQAGMITPPTPVTLLKSSVQQGGLQISPATMLGAPAIAMQGDFLGQDPRAVSPYDRFQYALKFAVQKAAPLAWAQQQGIPLEDLAMAMLTPEMTTEDLLGTALQLARAGKYASSTADPVIEKMRKQRAMALFGALPDEYKASLSMSERFTLERVFETTGGQSAQYVKQYGQLWSSAYQLGVIGEYTQAAPSIWEGMSAPISSGYTLGEVGQRLGNVGRLQGLFQAGGLQFTDYSAFAEQFFNAPISGQNNVLALMQWRPMQTTMFAYQAGIPELASMDVNAQGQLTGLPLWTTTWQLPGISGSQLASQIWGQDWQAGDISGVRQAMVEGGYRAVNWRMMELQAQQAREAAGLAAARQRLQYVFTTGRGLAAYGAQYAAPFQWSIEGVGSFNGGSGFWGYEDAMQALQVAQQRWQFGIQEQRMLLGEQYWQQNFGMNVQQWQAGVEYMQNQWGIQDTQRSLQFGWRISDIRENMQFATGRQRRVLERQLQRETVMYSLNEEQIQNQREYQETLWDIQKRRFDMEKEHHEEMYALQREEFEKAKEFFEVRTRLEEQYRKLRRKYYEEEYKLAMAQIGLSQKWDEIMRQAKEDMQKVKEAEEDHLGKLKVINELFATPLEYLEKIGIKMQEIIEPLAKLLHIDVSAIKQQSKEFSKASSSTGGTSSAVLPAFRASGGPMMPGLNYVHEGEVLVKSNEPLMVVPKWQASDFMANYYSTESAAPSGGGGKIDATLTVVLATEGLRQIVREVIHDEIGPVQ